MKNLKDLFDLVLKETELNNGKQCTYHFCIDTKYNWLSMYQCHNLDGIEDEIIMRSESFGTKEELQLVYWTIYNKGRVRHENEK